MYQRNDYTNKKVRAIKKEFKKSKQQNINTSTDLKPYKNIEELYNVFEK